jgi:hypothetical protein
VSQKACLCLNGIKYYSAGSTTLTLAIDSTYIFFIALGIGTIQFRTQTRLICLYSIYLRRSWLYVAPLCQSKNICLTMQGSIGEIRSDTETKTAYVVCTLILSRANFTAYKNTI